MAEQASAVANALRPTKKQLRHICGLIQEAESLSFSLPMASEDPQAPAVVKLFDAAEAQLHLAVRSLRRANGVTDVFELQK